MDNLNRAGRRMVAKIERRLKKVQLAPGPEHDEVNDLQGNNYHDQPYDKEVQSPE